MLEIKVTVGLEPKTAELLGEYLALGRQAAFVDAEVKQISATNAREPRKVQADVTEPQGNKAETESPAESGAQKAVKLDIEDVRAILAEAKHTHGLPKIKPILKKYGSGDLASVPSDKYEALVADIKALGA